MRASTANWKSPSATAGSSSDFSAGPTPSPQPSKPPDLNQPSFTAKRSTRRRPAQNAGTATPIWDKAMAR